MSEINLWYTKQGGTTYKVMRAPQNLHWTPDSPLLRPVSTTDTHSSKIRHKKKRNKDSRNVHPTSQEIHTDYSQY